MKITNQEVKYVANLARLNLNDDTTAKLAEQVSNILNYIDKLNEVDTTNVKPASPVQIANAFRDDEVRASLPVSEALQNAPEKNDNEFIVPKIIG